MTRTRTLLILGVFMLSLAVLAGLEWNIDDPVRTEGQMVTGTLDKTVHPLSEQTPSQSGSLPGTAASSNGVFVPLDNGTLRGESGSSLDMTGLRGQSDPSSGSTGTGEASAESVPPAPDISRPAPSAAPVASAAPDASAAQTSPVAPSSPALSAPEPTPAPSAARPEPGKVERADAGTGTKEPAAGTSARKARVERDASRPGEFTLTAGTPRLFAGQKGASSSLTIGKRVVLQVKGADALKAEKSLLLRNPDRFVVDLEGSWGIGIPDVPEGLWLKSIRVGRNDNTTRIVFDLTRRPASATAKAMDSRTLEIEIR